MENEKKEMAQPGKPDQKNPLISYQNALLFLHTKQFYTLLNVSCLKL